MKVHLIAVSHKQPQWVETAYQEYAKRLNQEFTLHLKELSPFSAKNASAELIKNKEAEFIRNAIPKNNFVIALDEHGKNYTSQELAKKMETVLQIGSDVSILIGGANGLDKSLLHETHERWSLSKMTLPHGLVRIVIAEQLYRAWSIIKCHPYHKI